jgi:hypothetical protein
VTDAFSPLFPELINAIETSGAAMEPAGVESDIDSDIDEARKGELSGDSESIEPACGAKPQCQTQPTVERGGGGNRTRE